MKLISRKELLIEKYKQLVETEEKRIKRIMAKKFGFLKTDKNTFDTMGVLKTRKQSASDYNYYRQRYYRLRKITEKEIYDRMKSYVFDDYVKSLEILVKRLGLDINNEEFKSVFKNPNFFAMIFFSLFSLFSFNSLYFSINNSLLLFNSISITFFI